MKNLKKYLIIALGSLTMLSCEKDEVKQTQANSESQMNLKNTSVSEAGKGGSLAQFIVVNDYLYTVDFKSIKVFDISNNPTLLNTVQLGYGIETIHAQENYIFIGTTNGVKILDISNPTSPIEVSEFEHVRSCDPVVANSDYIFSTVRGGTLCGGNLNELNIIDIRNIKEPTLFGSAELVNPYGLGFSANNSKIIYVCDGYDGLKGFDISDLTNPKMILHNKNIMARDVISTDNNILIVLGTNGIHQFDNTDPLNLIQKSIINI